MAKTAMIRARVEPGLKQQAEATLEDLGLSPTAAIGLFYRQIVHRRGLPFEVRIPNAKTQQAMREAETGENLIRADSMSELLVKLDTGRGRKRAKRKNAKSGTHR